MLTPQPRYPHINEQYNIPKTKWSKAPSKLKSMLLNNNDDTLWTSSADIDSHDSPISIEETVVIKNEEMRHRKKPQPRTILRRKKQLKKNGYGVKNLMRESWRQQDSLKDVDGRLAP